MLRATHPRKTSGSWEKKGNGPFHVRFAFPLRGESMEAEIGLHSGKMPTRKRLRVGERRLEGTVSEEDYRRAHHLALLAEKPASERGLEELVFGDVEEDEGLLRRFQTSGTQGGNVVGSNFGEESGDSEAEIDTEDNFLPLKKPVWVDEDDETEEIIDMTHRHRKNMMKSDAENKLSKTKLQRRFQEEFQGAMGTTPSWALRGMKNKTKRKTEHEGDTEDEEDDDLLHKTGNFVIASDSLPKGILQDLQYHGNKIKNFLLESKMKNCVHANNERVSDAKLTTVQFHPTAQVVLTAGRDRSISLFQVDGITNPQIQSIHLEDFPIYKARFSAEGDQVIATSIHNKLFYIYDMMEGKIIPINRIRGLEEKIVKKFEVSPDGTFLLLSGTSGYLHLITMKTKEFIGSMKINGRAIASSFSPDGSRIYTHSDEGEVFIWDVKSRRCLNKFTDEGCLHGTSIAVSKNSQYIACGSNSGVVNVYAHDDCIRETRPTPLKAIMNLVTPSTSLAFNPTTEILAMASNKMDDALKLVHIPSFTVFSNFPVFRRKLLYLAYCMDFSPRSGYFSIANNKGKALLYRLKHYSDF